MIEIRFSTRSFGLEKTFYISLMLVLYKYSYYLELRYIVYEAFSFEIIIYINNR